MTSTKQIEHLGLNEMRRIFPKLLQVENLYLKFILTVIAIALIVIAVELNNGFSDLFHVLWRIYQVV